MALVPGPLGHIDLRSRKDEGCSTSKGMWVDDVWWTVADPWGLRYKLFWREITPNFYQLWPSFLKSSFLWTFSPFGISEGSSLLEADPKDWLVSDQVPKFQGEKTPHLDDCPQRCRPLPQCPGQPNGCHPRTPWTRQCLRDVGVTGGRCGSLPTHRKKSQKTKWHRFVSSPKGEFLSFNRWYNHDEHIFVRASVGSVPKVLLKMSWIIGNDDKTTNQEGNQPAVCFLFKNIPTVPTNQPTNQQCPQLFFFCLFPV